jgi:RNA polymerase sigma-70 factor, ECF subfamily
MSQVESRDEVIADAVEEAYSRFAPKLLALLMRKLPRRQDADDVCQEIFVQLCRRMRTADLSQIRDLQSYVYGIAHHSLAQFYRRRKSAYVSLDDSLEALEEMKEVPAENSERDMELAVIASQAEKVLASMPPNQRFVALNCIFLGVSTAEVAKKLGVPLRTAERYRCSAMRLLNEALAQGKRLGTHDEP